MDDQFNNWVALWDKAQVDMPPAPAMRQANPNSSFFGMNSVDDDELDGVRVRDIDAWKDVNDRTDQLFNKVDSHQLYIEANKEEKKKKKKKKSAAESTHKEADPDETEGIGAILAKSLGDKEQFVAVNPIHFASVGIDQKPRVTPNWTSGTALIALAKLRADMYDLECEMLTAEAMGGKNMTTLENKLTSLQKQFDTLSQSIVPNPKNDVS